jgi:hypothetical protein
MRTVNADVVLAALREVGVVLSDRPRHPASTISIAKVRVARLIEQIEQQSAVSDHTDGSTAGE